MKMIKLILPYIETSRLILREIKRSDARSILEYSMDERVGPNAGWEAHKTIDDTLEYVNYAIKKRDFGQPGVFAIINKENYKLIGTIEVHSYKEFKGEIGFVLHPDYWNRGLVTEAAKAVIIYAMEILELERLQYCHFKGNEASKKVCEKLEFTFEGILRNKYLMYDGKVMDDVTYSITSNDYLEGKISWVEKFKKVLFIDY
jgi:ribosomal-protein-alanine N-acetyltransferase